MNSPETFVGAAGQGGGVERAAGDDPPRAGAARGRSWAVSVQVAFSTGEAWSCSGWYGPTDGFLRGGVDRWYSTSPT